jgi:predicted phage terminase large subunit-like protein
VTVSTLATLPPDWRTWPLPAQERLLKTLRTAARKRKIANRRQWQTPGELAAAVEPTTVQTPALDLIDGALVEVAEGRCDRLIITMPPQEGKSTRVTTIGPLWMLTRNPDLRIAIACYAQDLADEFGRNIRNHIIANDGTDDTLDLGLRIAPDNGAARRWRIDGYRGGVRSVGITSGLTGKPAEMLYIDDPIKDMRDADSKAWREVVWSFWQAVANTRLAPGAPVIIILTRWHEEDLAGKVLAAEDAHRWKVLNIPAQADHDPNKGETDPLGREPGEFMVSARGRSVEQWRQTQVAVGSRVWAALYQGRPTPAAGDIFQREWWREYTSPRWIERPDGTCWAPGADEVAMSWDMAFKDTDGSDYVVGQVWARYGLDLFLLDQVHDRLSFTATCAALRDMAAKWPQATLKLVEDKANGTAVINSLRRQVPGLVPVEPDGSKEARARAVTPFIEAGSVYLPAPELCPWVGGFRDEHASFPNGSHDDQVDACTQAINRMLLAPILAGDLVVDAEDVDDELADFQISQY